MELQQDNNFTSHNPFSSEFFAILEDMASRVYRLTQFEKRIAKAVADMEKTPPAPMIIPAITGTFTEDGTNKWKYAWSEARCHTDGKQIETLPNTHRTSQSGTQLAYNLWEQNNTASLTTLGLSLEHPNATIVLQPIPEGTPVLMMLMGKPPQMTPAWFFIAPNEIAVTCSDPGGGVPTG